MSCRNPSVCVLVDACSSNLCHVSVRWWARGGLACCSRRWVAAELDLTAQGAQPASIRQVGSAELAGDIVTARCSGEPSVWSHGASNGGYCVELSTSVGSSNCDADPALSRLNQSRSVSLESFESQGFKLARSLDFRTIPALCAAFRKAAVHWSTSGRPSYMCTHVPLVAILLLPSCAQ